MRRALAGRSTGPADRPRHAAPPPPPGGPIHARIRQADTLLRQDRRAGLLLDASGGRHALHLGILWIGLMTLS
ncbi:hypothetical protein ACFQU2_12685 [Siccirubricoccus deserti]